MKRFISKQTSWMMFVVFAFTAGFAQAVFASQAELDSVKNGIRNHNAHWNANVTSVSELPDSERHIRGSGVIQYSSVGTTGSTGSGGTVTSAPAAFDWRNVNGTSFVTPVENQGGCGSCWAFAATAALESQVLLSTGQMTDLSEQIMVSCSGAGSCSGGYPGAAASYLVSTGLPDQSYFPYSASDQPCSNAVAGWQNYTHKVWSTVNVADSASAIESAVATYGPITTTMNVYSDFYYYAGGVYTYTSGSYVGGHAVTIVGYDHVNQFFIVKNSWGMGWGEGGFFRIAYSEMSDAVSFGVESIAYYSSNASPIIYLTSPVGGENYIAGSTANIQWSFQGSPGSTVNITLLANGQPQSVIASGVSIGASGVGSYSWAIPSSTPTGSIYQITVTSTSNAGYTSTSPNVFTISPPPPPPAAPANLKASVAQVSTKHGKKVTTTTVVNLSWSASSSTAGISQYKVFRNGTLLTSTSATSYSDSGTVTGGGTYTYTVEAVDGLGQVSPQSSPASVSR